MYSLVLMTVMAGSGDTAAFGRTLGRGCCGGGVSVHYSSCSGCTGNLASSCSGSCHGSSCQGASCFGSCTGSSCHGGRLGLFRRHSSCHGCTGSSCIGSGCTGSGCVGSGAIVTEGMPIEMTPAAPATPATPAAPAKPATPAPAPMPMGKTTMNANITVEVPAHATLKVDGVVVAGEGNIRQFHTPELAANQQYFYDMTAEVTVDGKIETQTRRVVVTAGKTVTTTFETLGVKTIVASK